MKTISLLSRAALCALILGTAGVSTSFAQTTPAPAPDNAKGGHAAVLTDAEKAELDKARDQVLAANPDLKKESDAVAAQREKVKIAGASASKDDRKAAKQAGHDLEAKLRPAMLKVDPNLAPIFAKLDAAHAARKAAAAATPSNT
jgi:hypothetical protein